MGRLLVPALLTAILATAAGQPINSQPAPEPSPASFRCLFIIDSSLSMERQGEGIPNTVIRLILNGLDGQLQPGDIFGIWTFNAHVRADAFPAVAWYPAQAQALASQAFQFLNTLRFDGKTRMDRLLVEMLNAVRVSERLTIVIFSDGESQIVGSPFDQSINTVYLENRRSLRKDKIPFVTILNAQKGEFVSWAIHSADERFEIPGLPNSAPAVSAIQPAVSPAAVPEIESDPATPLSVAPPLEDPSREADSEPDGPVTAIADRELEIGSTDLVSPPEPVEAPAESSTKIPADSPGAASPPPAIPPPPSESPPADATNQSDLSGRSNDPVVSEGSTVPEKDLPVRPEPALELGGERSLGNQSEASPSNSADPRPDPTQTEPRPDKLATSSGPASSLEQSLETLPPESRSVPTGVIAPASKSGLEWKRLSIWGGGGLLLVIALVLLKMRAPRASKPSLISKSFDRRPRV